ncbi:pyrroloquinoline quinone biosynthesis protein PqqE [Marinibacterium profundimaris]|uniref:PqqA peptide cyclase n=1 Tax=Marinibacterium profundimaris TaxID=1679460 RepID=A0A225NS44_9RHOB|nr:pyrroloquinoline quinone biosynthesis protein PqqE [Marinibacterium profundimaris]OWU77663.1 pyrroloquinoline quinone biosynthesis protein PqqE [Marinibacterium profundimaris]
MPDTARISVQPPIAMLAELTHRCPLACPYCSNPLEMTGREAELDTETWLRAFREAAEMGVLQLHLSGGEPVSRRDIVELAKGAREAGLYVNLITSGIGLTDARLQALEPWVDHIQLSLQGVTAAVADRIGGYTGGFERKMHVAERIGQMGFPLTLNAVMHRHNLDDLPATLDMAVRLGARRIEVACVQFQGWALKNRAMLQPSRDQVDEAKRIVARARRELKGRLAIDFVPPDYYADYPKACMGGGWGSTGLNIAPDGKVLPCHAAETIPGLTFRTIAEAGLREIWYDSAAFNAFRGTDWMPELCQTCDRRDVDFGGCRCQAMAIAGDPTATDPVCRKSPHRALVDAALEIDVVDAAEPDFVYRRL